MTTSRVGRLICGMAALGAIGLSCGTAAAEGRLLNSTTRMETPAPANQGLDCQGGQTATVDAKGRVLGCAIASDTLFKVAPAAKNSAVMLKGGQVVSFNAQGYVKNGILAKDTLLAVSPDKNPACVFKSGTMIFFRDTGYVSMGTLASNKLLNQYKKPAAVFKANTVVNFMNNGLVSSGETTIEGEPAPTPPGPPAPPAPASVVNETSWIVNNHAVPWVFHANGVVEAPNLWKGSWKKAGNEYAVTITHQGATDSFTVRFAPDGKTFTAYKGANVYRKGVRK